MAGAGRVSRCRSRRWMSSLASAQACDRKAAMTIMRHEYARTSAAANRRRLVISSLILVATTVICFPSTVGCADRASDRDRAETLQTIRGDQAAPERQQQQDDAERHLNAIAHFNLRLVYLETGNRAAAREQHRILATLDATLASRLLGLMERERSRR